MGQTENRRFIYGRRQGHRLHPRQAKLVDSLLPTLRLDLAQAKTLDKCFDRPRQSYALEIGFGGGEHLAARAAANPDTGYIGCEPFINGVATLLSELDRHQIQNVRIFDDDARILLSKLPTASVSKIYVLFPDPWPKTRHNRRRFINPETLSSLSRVAKDKASFVFASDHMGYVAWTLAETQRHPDWLWLANGPEDWRQQPEDWVPTRYGAKALRKGDKPAYLTFMRKKR